MGVSKFILTLQALTLLLTFKTFIIMKSKEIRDLALSEILSTIQIATKTTIEQLPVISTAWDDKNRDKEFLKVTGLASKSITIKAVSVFKNKKVTMSAIIDVYKDLFNHYLRCTNSNPLYKDEEFIYSYNTYPLLKVVNNNWCYVIEIVRFKIIK